MFPLTGDAVPNPTKQHTRPDNSHPPPARPALSPLPPAIALAGNPNCGKTTLFNSLTGLRQHVGNYPGVTVEKKSGLCHYKGQDIEVVDLPGTYSLTAYSVEEVVARDYLVTAKPRVVVNVLDASNLERNLYLTSQLMELGAPLVIALNMMDVARDRGVIIAADRLAELLGVPVVPIVARTGEGREALLRTVAEAGGDSEAWTPSFFPHGEDIDTVLAAMTGRIEQEGLLTETCPARWTALKYLEQDSLVLQRGRAANPTLDGELRHRATTLSRHLESTLASSPEALIADQRYGFIRSILRQGVLRQEQASQRLYLSDRIDQVLTNRFLGPLIMLAVLFGLYQFTFTFSKTPVAWTEDLFEWLSRSADGLLADGPVKSLFISGIIDGVGGVLGFVPLIMFMFLGIAVLEDSGYLARVAFMMDRIFRFFGLHGSSVMAYIVSGGIAGGCAVPGVMATRTLRSPKERLATLLTVPMMNCGAKLPVLALLTGAFFSEDEATMMFGLTLLAWAVSLLTAKLLRSTILRGDSTPFVMELPPYRLPTFRGLAIHTWERTWQYIKKAGTVILAISVLLWALMTFPGLPEAEQARFTAQRTALTTEDPQSVTESTSETLAAIDAEEAQATLRHSAAGRIGTLFENVSWLAGFDWRTNIALVGGFAAKEVVISTLGTAYSLGEVDPEAATPLAETLARSPAWTPVKALALIVFIMFYAPCFVTVVCMVRESGSWKWGLFSMAFNTAFAFGLAVAVYQAGTALHDLGASP